MLNRCIIFFLLIFSAVDFHGQVMWERTYGTNGKETASAIISTKEPGYLIAGNTNSFLKLTQAYLIKIDELGSIEWSKTYGGASVEDAKDIVQLPDSGYILAGLTNSFGKMYQGYVARVDKEGELLWQKNYGGDDWDIFNRLVLLPDTSVVIVGETYSYGEGNKDGYILRIDKNGDTLWTKTFGGGENDVFNDVLINTANELVVVGSLTDTATDYKEALVVWFSLTGDLIRDTTFGGSLNDEFYSILEVDNGDFIAVGGSEDFPNDYAGWMVRINNQGELLGQVYQPNFSANSSGDQLVKAVAKYENLDYFAAGLQQIQTPGFPSFIKTSRFYETNGGTLNYSNIGSNIQKVISSGNIFVADADTCKDGGYIYCMYSDGQIGPFAIGNEKIYVIKVDSLNNTVCSDQDANCVNETYDFSSDLVSVEDNNKSVNLKVFPNPTSVGLVTITSNEGVNAYKIMDLTGRIVISVDEISSREITIETKGLKPATYLVVIKLNNYTITKRLIVGN